MMKILQAVSEELLMIDGWMDRCIRLIPIFPSGRMGGGGGGGETGGTNENVMFKTDTLWMD